MDPVTTRAKLRLRLPELIGYSKIWAVPGYARDPFSRKF